jgi:hypothetical protein
MREIKIRVPKGQAASVARLALNVGISQVASRDIYIHGLEETNEELKIKSSTPKIRRFLSALFHAPFYNKKTYQFSSHDIRALVTADPIRSVTVPACIPFSDIQQDLWQYSHITSSFVIRVMVSAGLLAYAMIKDDTVLGIGAMIFTPFSPLILAIAFGLVCKELSLVQQGLKAFAIALLLTVGAAWVVAKVVGGPMLFSRFGTLPVNLVISAVTGVMAAVADADDVGRRQLLGLAMAYPFVKFPTWLGIALGVGFPDHSTTLERVADLIGNPLLMMATAAAVYWILGRRGERKDLPV